MGLKNLFKKIKNHIKTVLTIKENPKEIAAGFTLGTILAVLPTFGLGIFLGLGLMFIFRKISKISMFAAFGVWNAAVLIPVYSLSYLIGNLILGDMIFSSNFKFIVNEQLYIYSMKFLLGNAILAVIISISAYLLIYRIADKYQKQYKEYIVDPIEKNVVDPIEELI